MGTNSPTRAKWSVEVSALFEKLFEVLERIRIQETAVPCPPHGLDEAGLSH